MPREGTSKEGKVKVKRRVSGCTGASGVQVTGSEGLGLSAPWPCIRGAGVRRLSALCI